MQNGILHSELGVWEGNDGHLFLADGPHVQVNGNTLDANITDLHVSMFLDNIARRKNSADFMGARYLHTIFPDKHSAVKCDYEPLRDNYVSSYIKRCNHIFSENVLLLHKVLSENASLNYKVNDTHLSAIGNIVSSVAIVAELTNDTSLLCDLADLQKLISEPAEFIGDLGSRFEPKVVSLEANFHPNWKFKIISNDYFGGNDGIIDIVISAAPKNKGRIIIYGDSFLRHSLPTLSYYFSEILFLRTRYMHEEFLKGFKPDFILTGQIERYLSDICNDLDAPLFLLYPHLRSKSSYTLSDEMLEALNSILHYGSKSYTNFMSKALI